MLQNIDAAKARSNFSDLLGQVYYGGKKFLIKRMGKPFAVLVDVEEYRKFEKMREEFFAEFESSRDKRRDVSITQVKKDVEDAVKAVRRTKKK